jgi:hypothetical protein
MNKLKLLDLFSGIGGFSLGLESTGYFQTIAFVEKDKFCRQVLQKNFNNIPIEEDIRNVRGSNYAADVITGGFPANHSALQEKEREQTMIAISGMKLLESLPNANRSGLLGKMLKDLLTSTTAWSSDRCKLIWKSKVSKSNVLLFQLQASVLGIKGKESGLWLTPTATDIATRSEEALQKRKEYRKSIGRTTTPPGNLAEQVQYGKPTTNMYPTPTQDSASERTKKYKQGGTPLSMAVKMFPTPTASCQMDVVAPPETVQQNSKGWSVTRVGTGTKFGAKLNDVVNKIEKMYNTPTTNDAKNLTFPKSQTNRTSIVGNLIQQEQIKPGGKLNPNFVEFLMGYPMNWTKIDQAE